MAAADVVAKKAKAFEIAELYGVKPSDLQKADTPAQMEIIALQLKLKNVSAGQTPAQIVDVVKGTPVGRDLSALTPLERLGAVLEEAEKK